MKELLIQTLIFQTLPGMLGGITLICYNFKTGHYKNNKFIKKISLELLGASITGTIISNLFSDFKQGLIITIAFCIGVCWAVIIKSIRNKVTKIVEAVIGETF